MEQRDYLLRQIEALGRILTRLRDMIVGGATAEAGSNIQREMKNAGLELTMANSLDPNTLLMLLGSPKLDARRAHVVGALLHMDALRARADGDDAWAARSFRAAETLLVAARPHLDADRGAHADQLLEDIRATTTALTAERRP
jgi:hypothetical protein